MSADTGSSPRDAGVPSGRTFAGHDSSRDDSANIHNGGDAISHHLHSCTTSLHSLLLLYAEAGFDSLPAEALQEMLLKMVSNVTNAARLFTQYQKTHDASVQNSAELADTVRRLSPLVRGQQEQIKLLKQEIANEALALALKSRADCGTMTDFNVADIEEKIMVSSSVLY